MSSRPVKKVHYTASTKGSSVHGGSSFTPPLTSRPTSSTRRQSFSHQRHPSDSGVGSSSSNSASAQVNSASFYSDAERFEQRHNVAALNEALNTLKDRVQALEHENHDLKNDLAESNRDRREMRRQCEDHLRTIEDLKKEKSRAKEGRDGKDNDGIRIRGSDVKITPETKKERVERVAERHTPPVARREKEPDSSEARRREDENLRAQHQARGRRASHRESQQDSPSRLYRSEERGVNPMTPNSRYGDERRNSATLASAKPPNPFAPIGPIGGRYGRRERDEVPYIRGEVPVHIEISGRSRGLRLSGSWGSMNDDLYPNDGNYHLYPLEI